MYRLLFTRKKTKKTSRVARLCAPQSSHCAAASIYSRPSTACGVLLRPLRQDSSTRTGRPAEASYPSTGTRARHPPHRCTPQHPSAPTPANPALPTTRSATLPRVTRRVQAYTRTEKADTTATPPHGRSPPPRPLPRATAPPPPHRVTHTNRTVSFPSPQYSSLSAIHAATRSSLTSDATLSHCIKRDKMTASSSSPSTRIM